VTEYKLTPNPMPHIHPFSMLSASDELIFAPGVGGFDDNGEISDDVVEQTRTAIAVMSGFLQEAGSSLAEIVYFRTLVTKREYAPQLNDVFAELLPKPLPTTAALIICDLADPRMKVEIEAIAHRGARLTVAD
jgi:2-iminobutanoate/2-iminopropanoate deaminase